MDPGMKDVYLIINLYNPPKMMRKRFVKDRRQLNDDLLIKNVLSRIKKKNNYKSVQKNVCGVP